MENTPTIPRQIAVINEDGDIFQSREALDAWEQWVNAKLAAAEKSPVVSHETAMQLLDDLEAHARRRLV